MKKKILTFLMAICFILPCAFIAMACGPTRYLVGFDVYIKGVQTDTFTCEWGQDAITASDVKLVAKYSTGETVDLTINDFDVSISWNNTLEGEQGETGTPNFWTEKTTANDLITIYTFDLKLKDGVLEDAPEANRDAWFSVEITRASDANSLGVAFTKDGNTTDDLTVEWTYNMRNYENESSLCITGCKEAEVPFALYYVVTKQMYNSFQTQQAKQEFVQQQEAFHGDFTNLNPGYYYIFAYVHDSDTYTYGWVWDYASLEVSTANAEQEIPETYPHVFNFNQCGSDDFCWDAVSPYIRSEISIVEIIDDNLNWATPKLAVKHYYSQYESTLLDDNTNSVITTQAVEEGGKYYQIERDLEEGTWRKTSNNQEVTDTSKISLVKYYECEEYKNGLSITVPVYYQILKNTGTESYFNFNKIYKTYIKLDKALFSEVPVYNKDTYSYNEEKGCAEFVFRIDHTDFTDDLRYMIEISGNQTLGEYYDAIYAFSGGQVTGAGNHTFTVALKNHNYAWIGVDEGYSDPITFDFIVNKLGISKADYEDDEYQKHYEYYEDGKAIEIGWGEITYNEGEEYYEYPSQYYYPYEVGSNSNIFESHVNVYIYKLVSGDESLTREQLIAKVKTTQALDSDDSKCILNSNNNTPGKVLLMFDIIDKANTYWENDDDATDQTDTAEKLFMFEVVKIDQRVEFKDLYLNYENTFTFDAEGKFDLNTLLETYEYSEMTDAPFVLSVVTDSENTTAPAGYTLEDGILAIDLEAAEDPLGSWYIQITKAGDVGHNDYTAYFTVKAEPNYIGNEAQEYTRWLQNAENNQYYKTAEESGEEYDGFVFTSGMTIAEILGTMPEEFTTYSDPELNI